MPLVELKKCPECGATTWHELVDHGPPAPCYWRCRTCGERRAARRIQLSQDHALHRGHVQKPTSAAQVQILDLSVLGARLRLTDAPEEALIAAGATHDLIVIGRDSTLGLEVNDDGLAPVIEALLRGGARPLLVVPPGKVPAAGGVLVGNDGSVPAMRAMQLFALLGLGKGLPVKVLSVAVTQAAA